MIPATFTLTPEQVKARIAFGISDPFAPLCVSYGMGVDSTAMLIAMHRAGVRPDLITFADTGDEKPETYAYLPIIQAWLASVGFPPVVVVRYADYAKHDRYATLYENCIANETLPGLAFGGKSCSLKYKAEVQNRYRATWAPAVQWWRSGSKSRVQAFDKKGRPKFYAKGPKKGQPRLIVQYEKRVIVCIGYDDGPKDSKRGAVAADGRYTYEYPLRALGWDRDECARQILAAGLPLPPKSACFYCPSTTPEELAALDDAHPELGDKIIFMETLAKPNLTNIQGLWRNGCKGTRGGVAKPGAMSQFIREHREKRDRLHLPVLDSFTYIEECA